MENRQISIAESLLGSKNPFNRFVKEEFRFQTESVRRLNSEINKVTLDRRNTLCTGNFKND